MHSLQALMPAEDFELFHSPPANETMEGKMERQHRVTHLFTASWNRAHKHKRDIFTNRMKDDWEVFKEVVTPQMTAHGITEFTEYTEKLQSQTEEGRALLTDFLSASIKHTYDRDKRGESRFKIPEQVCWAAAVQE